jgi:hypothetical protein
VKFVRILSRIALLSLAAAAFVGLTLTYGRSMRPPLLNPYWLAEHRHRPSAPQGSYFPEFAGEVMLLALFAIAGRVVFRLRLNPVSRGAGKPIALDLRQPAAKPLPRLTSML